MLHIKNEILSKRHFHVINYATFLHNIDSTCCQNHYPSITIIAICRYFIIRPTLAGLLLPYVVLLLNYKYDYTEYH